MGKYADLSLETEIPGKDEQGQTSGGKYANLSAGNYFDALVTEPLPKTEAIRAQEEFDARLWYKKAALGANEAQKLQEQGVKSPYLNPFGDVSDAIAIGWGQALDWANREGAQGVMMNAPMMVASMTPQGAGASMLSRALGMATAGMVGQMGSNMVTGKKTSAGELAASALQGGMPSATRGLADMALQGTTAVNAANLGSYLDRGKTMGGQEALAYGGLNAGIVGAFRGAGKAAVGLGNLRIKQAEAMDAAKRAGIAFKDLPPEVVNPNLAKEVAYQKDRGSMSGAKAKRTVTELAAGKMIEPDRKGLEMPIFANIIRRDASAIRGATKTAEQAKQDFLAATNSLGEAKAKFDAIKAAGDLGNLPNALTDFQNTVKMDAEVALQNALFLLGDRAKKQMASGLAVSPLVRDRAHAAEQFAQLATETKGHIKSYSDRLYGAVENNSTPAFPKNEVTSALKAHVSRVETDTLGRIDDMIKTLPEGDALTFSDVKRLRSAVYELIEKGSIGTGGVNAELKRTYSQLSDIIDTHAPKLGENEADLIRKANKVYAEYADIFMGDAMKFVQDKRTAPATAKQVFNELADNGMRSPIVQDWTRSYLLMKSIPGMSETAEQYRGAFGLKINEWVKAQNTDFSTRQIDLEGYAKDLAKLSSSGALQHLGIANDTMVKEIQQVSKKFPGLSMTPEMVSEMMSSSAYKQALDENRSIVPVLEAYATNRELFKFGTIAAALKEAGKFNEAEQLLRKAEKVAESTGVSVGVAQNALAKASTDEIAQRAQKLGIGDGTGAGAVASVFLDPHASKAIPDATVKGYMSALRSSGNPTRLAQASYLERYALANAFDKWLAGDMEGGVRRIDPKKVYNFFSDSVQTAERNRLAAILSDGAQIRIAQAMPLIERLAKTDVSAQGLPASVGGIVSKQEGVAKSVWSMLKLGKTHSAAFLAMNPSYSGKLGTVADLVSAVGAERATQLLLLDQKLKEELTPKEQQQAQSN